MRLDRAGQPRWASADDDDIEQILFTHLPFNRNEGESTEKTEITEQTEGFDQNLFRLFRYFRLFRTLSSCSFNTLLQDQIAARTFSRNSRLARALAVVSSGVAAIL